MFPASSALGGGGSVRWEVVAKQRGVVSSKTSHSLDSAETEQSQRTAKKRCSLIGGQ